MGESVEDDAEDAVLVVNNEGEGAGEGRQLAGHSGEGGAVVHVARAVQGGEEVRLRGGGVEGVGGGGGGGGGGREVEGGGEVVEVELDAVDALVEAWNLYVLVPRCCRFSRLS